MRYVECPAEWTGAGTDVGLFLGGGITGCPDWQAEIVQKLADTALTLLSPRRAHWDASIDPREQIEWEHRHLLRANAIVFWFCKETLCPITLYELGNWVFRPKKLFLGCAEGYTRVLDVEIQIGLERPRQTVHRHLDSLAAEVIEWHKAMASDPLHRAADQIKPTEYNHAGVPLEQDQTSDRNSP